MFPVSLFPMLRFHLQHLFTTLVHLYKFTLSHSLSVALHLTKLGYTRLVVSVCDIPSFGLATGVRGGRYVGEVGRFGVVGVRGGRYVGEVGRFGVA